MNSVDHINAVTEAGRRDLVEQNHILEILCAKSPKRKSSVWYGLWTMRAVSQDGHERHLVTARRRKTPNDISVREFKTVTGVVSFLLGIDFSNANIPMKVDQRTPQSFPKG